MFKRTVSPEDLARLKREREEADAAYNRAISALDDAVRQFGAIQDPGEFPHPKTHPDDIHAALLGRGDLIGSEPAFTTGLRGRLQRFVWSVVTPVLQHQREFNRLLVAHITTDAGATAKMAERVRVALERTVDFHSRLLGYAQTLTPFIDTKDYEVSGLMRRINEDVAETNAGLAATVEGVADELRKRWETTLARERRIESQMEDLRATAAAAHQVTQTLKRELGRIGTGAPSATNADPTSDLRPQAGAPTAALDSYKYVGFEDLYRGSADDVRARLESYLPYFEHASDVLDVGCGRGEFLELLGAHGISARGIDINHEMVERCRAGGLTVDETDLRSYLSQQPDGSLGGLFAAQVVEHLEPAYLLESLDAAFHKLRPGATMVLETINVASWSAFFQSYVRDITHVRPLHPDTLRYLVTASGFQDVEVVYRSPSPEQDRLEQLEGFVPHPDNPGRLNDLVVAFNENVEKLNRLMFSDQDYAVIGRRL